MSNRNFDSRVIIQRLQNQVYARNLYKNNVNGQGLINNPQNSDGNASRFNSYVPGAQTDYFRGLIGAGETVSLGGTFGISSIPASTAQTGSQGFSAPTPNIWTLLGRDIDGEAASDGSGYSVSLSADGSIVAIGAYGNDGNGSNSGHVRVYKNISNVWTQLGQDINGEVAGDNSGYSVSLSADGSTVAIGAYLNGGNGTYSGHVRVYKNISNVWTRQGQDIDGEATFDQSGISVSLSADGSIVAIGAHYNDGNGFNSGHVRVYKNISNVWTQLGQDINGEAANDNSGYSVSLSADGSTVAIGAYFNGGNGLFSGHVRVYKNISNVWTQLGQDIDGEAVADLSGWSVSLSANGSVVAIGAYGNDGNDGNDINSGHVRVYKNISNVWTQLGQDIDGEVAGDQSGYSVSLSADGSTVAIGAISNGGNGSNSGHVRVYKNISNVWTQLGRDIDGEVANDNSGISVSLSADGSIVAIGSTVNDGNGYNSGHVRVYKYYSLV